MKLNQWGYEGLVEGDLEWLQAQLLTLESRHIADVLKWSVKALYEENALKVAVQALIDSLPKCGECANPATRAFSRGSARYCDDHGGTAPDYPRAAPLRALIELLKERR